MTIPDYPDWQDPQAHATAIAQTGVPLLNAPAMLEQAFGLLIPGGGVDTLGPFTITQIGYALSVSANFPAGTANSYIRVQLKWVDSVSSTEIATETYYLPGSSGATYFQTLGGGISKADTLSVVITNLDSAEPVTLNVTIDQDSVTRVTDTWYWNNTVNNGLTVPSNTLATLPPDELVLGYVHNVTVPATDTNVWLFGTAPGKAVTVTGFFSGIAASSITVQGSPAPNSDYSGASLLFYEVLSSLWFTATFPGPRAPIYLKITNGATTGTLTCNVGMVAQQ